MKTINFISNDNIEYIINTEQITYIIKYQEVHALVKLACGTELVAPYPVEKLLELIGISEGDNPAASEPIH